MTAGKVVDDPGKGLSRE